MRPNTFNAHALVVRDTLLRATDRRSRFLSVLFNLRGEVTHMTQTEFPEGELPLLRSRAVKSALPDVHFVDAMDVAWRAYERYADRDPGAPFPLCLIFESRDAFRRVWVYPAEWRSRDGVALEALSWQK